MEHVIIYDANKVSAQEAGSYAIAQQLQLNDDYAPMYDGDGENDSVSSIGVVLGDGDTVETACLTMIASGQIRADERPLLLLESMPAEAGELGVHGRLPDGRPVCRAFRLFAVQTGTSWTSILSHEVLEARRNPRLTECVEQANGQITDEEICDRVQAQTYVKNGVELSNFNGPAAFQPNADSGTAGAVPDTVFDFLRMSTAADQVQPGGYAQDFTTNEGWKLRGEMSEYTAELDRLGMSRTARIRRAHAKAQAAKDTAP